MTVKLNTSMHAFTDIFTKNLGLNFVRTRYKIYDAVFFVVQTIITLEKVYLCDSKKLVEF